MTKKDYELIGDCLIEAKRLLDIDQLGYDLIENAFVERLAKDNPRFDPELFYDYINN